MVYLSGLPPHELVSRLARHLRRVYYFLHYDFKYFFLNLKKMFSKIFNENFALNQHFSNFQNYSRNEYQSQWFFSWRKEEEISSTKRNVFLRNRAFPGSLVWLEVEEKKPTAGQFLQRPTSVRVGEKESSCMEWQEIFTIEMGRSKVWNWVWNCTVETFEQSYVIFKVNLYLCQQHEFKKISQKKIAKFERKSSSSSSSSRYRFTFCSFLYFLLFRGNSSPFFFSKEVSKKHELSLGIRFTTPVGVVGLELIWGRWFKGIL